MAEAVKHEPGPFSLRWVVTNVKLLLVAAYRVEKPPLVNYSDEVGKLRVGREAKRRVEEVVLGKLIGGWVLLSLLTSVPIKF